MANMKFEKFLDKPVVPRCCLKDFRPDNALDQQGLREMLKIGSCNNSPGLYSTDLFYEWMNGPACLDGLTFGELKNRATRADNEEWAQELRIITSDLTAQAMRILPDDLCDAYGENPDTFVVAEAVRQSMSIPLFFAPQLQKGHNGEGHDTDYTIVDGGVLSNYPLWCAPPVPGRGPVV